MKFCKFPLLLTVIAAMAVPAMANVQVSQIQLDTTAWQFQSGSGGEFNATVIALPQSGLHLGKNWQTFCLEKDETVSTPTGTYYAVINTAAVTGGVGGVAGGNPLYPDAGPDQGDPLSAQTAYLYTQFANGTLSNYAFAGTQAQRKTSAAALQNAIWYLEGEIGSVSGQALTWVNAANAAVNSGAWTGLGQVRVLNLYANYVNGQVSGQRQDVLVLVPAPAAAMLAFVGLGLVGWVKRRVG